MRLLSFPLILSLALIALTPASAWARFDGGASPNAQRTTIASAAPARPMPSISRAEQAATAVVAPKAAPRVAQAPGVEPLSEWVLYLPPDARNRQPLQVLVAMHGMGGNGPDFARPLLPNAEAMGWAVLAPTMPYRDFRDPELVSAAKVGILLASVVAGLLGAALLWRGAGAGQDLSAGPSPPGRPS